MCGPRVTLGAESVTTQLHQPRCSFPVLPHRGHLTRKGEAIPRNSAWARNRDNREDRAKCISVNFSSSLPYDVRQRVRGGFCNSLQRGRRGELNRFRSRSRALSPPGGGFSLRVS